MSNRKQVIVKKVKKVNAAGHHGGQWKVAYADFVTAMMAFFLLLWLLSMVSEEKRARISEYYKNFSLYTESGSTFMSGSDSDLFNKTTAGAEKVLTELEGDEKAAEDIQESLNKAIASKLGDLENQVLVEKVRDGIRIHLTDNEGSTMFKRGSTEMTPKAKEVLCVIAENIKHIKNKVSIEGHTDALPFAGKDYSNWELSTERASSARKELEADGLDPKRLISVAGFADTDPLIKDDPNDARNRRISIILKFPKKEKKKGLIANKTDNPVKKVSEDLMKIIDRSTVTARGNDDKDSVNVVADSHAKHNAHKAPPSSSMPKKSYKPISDKQAKEDDQKAGNNEFTPVLDENGWQPIILFNRSGGH